MSEHELSRDLCLYIGSELMDAPVDDLDRDEELLVSGLLDSLAIAQLIDYLEQRTGLDIPPQDLVADNFRSVSAMLTYLGTRA